MNTAKMLALLVALLGVNTASANVVTDGVSYKSPIENFNPQPDPPGKSIILE